MKLVQKRKYEHLLKEWIEKMNKTAKSTGELRRTSRSTWSSRREESASKSLSASAGDVEETDGFAANMLLWVELNALAHDCRHICK